MSTYAPPRIADAVDTIARRRGVSVSRALRELVADALERGADYPETHHEKEDRSDG